jgi:hypothetical protein
VTLPARRAEPGAEISWTTAEGTARILTADANGRIIIHDQQEADATADLPDFKEPKPAGEPAQSAKSDG